MRKAAFVIVAVLILGPAVPRVSSAHGACSGTHRHTAAGSCKTTGGQVRCGTTGTLVGEENGFFLNLHANSTPDGAEAEVCSDEGSGNQQGRLVVQASTKEQGARAVLDSDADQSFSAGYILVQVDPQKPGVWCAPTPGAYDGYAASWDAPGAEGGTDPATWSQCLPGN